MTYMPKNMFKHYNDASNSGTSETTLYTDTIKANVVNVDGMSIVFDYGGISVAGATATRSIRLYFAGNTIIAVTGFLTTSDTPWSVSGRIMRTSSSTAKIWVVFSRHNAVPIIDSFEMTGLNFTTDNVISISGQAQGVGADSNQVTAKVGVVSWGN